MKNTIEQITSKFGFGMSIEELASRVYVELAALGFTPCLVNDRYIEVDGTTYQLRKTRSKGHWTVREF